jgi:hypothetical protein
MLKSTKCGFLSIILIFVVVHPYRLGLHKDPGGEYLMLGPL